jgi:hypothetical protein
MCTRYSKRKSHFLRAIAVLAATAGISSAARAGIMVDMRAVGGGVITGGGKSVDTALASTVTIGVFVRLSGTNSVQQIGDFQGLAESDTRNDDSLRVVTGSFQSIGPLHGNMAINGMAGPLTYGSRTSPFSSGGSSNGSAADWDGDGDLDIGNGNSTDPSTMWIAGGPMSFSATVFGGGGTGWSGGPSGNALSGTNSNDIIIDPTTQEVQVGTIRFVVTSSTGNSLINFVKRAGSDLGVEWFEDGVATGFLGQTGYTVGAPVQVGVPEPTSVGLLAVASLGLLARRHVR